VIKASGRRYADIGTLGCECNCMHTNAWSCKVFVELLSFGRHGGPRSAPGSTFLTVWWSRPQGRTPRAGPVWS